MSNFFFDSLDNTRFTYSQGKADDAWEDPCLEKDTSNHYVSEKEIITGSKSFAAVKGVGQSLTADTTFAKNNKKLEETSVTADATGKDVQAQRKPDHTQFQLSLKSDVISSPSSHHSFAFDSSSGRGREGTEKAKVCTPCHSENQDQAVPAEQEVILSPVEGSEVRVPFSSSSEHMKCFSLVDLPPVLILEIFAHIDARDLCIASCVCSTFQRLAAESFRWKDFYCQRWLPPALGNVSVGKNLGDDFLVTGRRWRDLYLEREVRARAFQGRFRLDFLHGHTAGVRCVRLLPSAGLAVTGGYDSTVRIWALDEGLPLAASAPLGETVRAIAVDSSMLAVGSTDGAVRIWRTIPECPYLFDVGSLWTAGGAAGTRPIGGANQKGGRSFAGIETLYGHSGPISCLAIDGGKLYSGSWDMTVRVWEQKELTCVGTFQHRDWVWAIAPRGGRLYSTAGPHLYSWVVESGELLRLRENVHVGHASAVEASRSGEFVFTGGEDGAVRMFDERMKRRVSRFSAVVEDGVRDAVAEWRPHTAGVRALAMEDPWLVCSSGDKTCSLMNVWQVMLNRSSGKGRARGKHVKRVNGESSTSSVKSSLKANGGFSHAVLHEGVEEPIQRQLGGSQSGVYSVDIGAHRVVCAGEDMAVRVFDFTQALETERRVELSRRVRVEKRLQRKASKCEREVVIKGVMRFGSLQGDGTCSNDSDRAQDSNQSGNRSVEATVANVGSESHRPWSSEKMSFVKRGVGKFREPGAAKQKRGKAVDRREDQLSKRDGPGETDIKTFEGGKDGNGYSEQRTGRYVDSVPSNFRNGQGTFRHMISGCRPASGSLSGSTERVEQDFDEANESL